MPERVNKKFRTVDSSAVQGKGSWVKIKSPTIADIKAAGNFNDSDMVETMEWSKSLIPRLVVEWNWVDDEGKELPQPNPEVISELPFEEINWLLKQINIEELVDQKK